MNFEVHRNYKFWFIKEHFRTNARNHWTHV